VRVLRNNVVVHQGELDSLKRFKDDVKEVPMGMECGIGVEGAPELRAGDIFEAYELIEIRPSLD